jgi:N-acetylmuramoyl-L-alanine amidase
MAFCLVAQMGSAFEAHTRIMVDEQSFAVFRNGRVLVLECYPPKRAAAEAFLKRYLAPGVPWSIYADKGGVAIPYSALKPETQRAMLLAVFRQDCVDDQGWHHIVTYSGRDQETLWTLAEWLTGRGTNADVIAKANGLSSSRLAEGQEVLFPKEVLLEVMRKPTPKVVLKLPEESMEEQEADLGRAAKGLTFMTREKTQYAVYRLKEGEALYTAVVVRFTDYRENGDIRRACESIARESGISDVRDIDTGTAVHIPIEMLSDRYKPESNPDRREYEAALQESVRLRGQVRTKDLQGVVVILDPGHGGSDPGATTVNHDYRLYEDEVSYDIACRIKECLERTTRAKVYVTMLDPNQQYRPDDATFFEFDKDEVVVTTPNYANHDPAASLILRWHLANSIYRRETKAGVDPRKVVFASIHCDSLYDERLRGAMVYIPGAAHRRDREGTSSGRLYAKYREVREQPEARSTPAERRRDEALSRNFAATLLDDLGKAQIKRHSVGDPIRSVIRQSGGRQYVPSVLRNTLVPTKVLVECANLTNPTDCNWASRPWWRQRFAEAYVQALKDYYR